MKLYEINSNFKGTWDEAIAQHEYHEVKELTEEEARNIAAYGCGELQFLS